MRLNPEVLISQEAIARRVRELAEAIAADMNGEPPLVLVVLKGAILFASDLVRALPLNASLDFIRAKSYAGCESQGFVELVHLPETPIANRQVLLVEDILDTGRTSAALLDWIREQHPASVRLCVLLDKPSRRMVNLQADYTGFTIEDRFVVGYGLDYDESFRNLPAVYVLEK